MTVMQLQFAAFGLIASAISAVVAAQLAPPDPTGGVPLKRRWNWAAVARPSPC
ncbi:hypothetical protein ACFV2I_33385 [Streptomyces microflavus]|uniref:hypothetical protein n=1 Tax=Streptomyces microflavus TaxID=1919 RepID=UPI003691475F